MSDRELLELAAKAAGVGPLDFDYAEREGHNFDIGPRLPMPQGILMAAMWTYWRPLEDDGDALKLAVKLGMELSLWGTDIFAKKGSHLAQIAAWPDRQFATRRAIVLVAADVGKAMP